MPALPEYSPEFRSRFHPDHLEDLRRSGLSEETITTLGIHTVPLTEVPRLLGWFPERVTSVLEFPYPGVDGFSRFKVFPPITDKDGHTVKYLQRKGSGVHLYVPPLPRRALRDPTVGLAITEGEKKAAKACQEDIPCIALGGLWNWLQEGRASPELDEIVWPGREAVLWPDSDTWQRRDLLCAVYAFARELEARGAIVYVGQLPAEGEAKVGLDDFLVTQGRAGLDQGWRLTLAHPAFEVARVWHREWTAKRDASDTVSSGGIAVVEPVPALAEPLRPGLPPFPLQAVGFPFAELIALLRETTAAAPEALFLGYSTYLGAALGRSVWVEYAGPLYPCDWSLLVGPPRVALKGTVLRFSHRFCAPLDEGLRVLAGLGSIERLAQELKATPARRILVRLGELATALAAAARSGTQNIIGELCELYNMEEAWDLGTKIAGEPIKHFTVGLLAATSPGQVAGLLRGEHLTGGLFCRFRVCQLPATDLIPLPKVVDQKRLGEIQEEVRRRLDHWHQSPRGIRLAPEAAEEWEAWHRTWWRAYGERGEGAQYATARTDTHILKTACLAAALQREECISPDTLLRAIPIGEYWETQTLAVVGELDPTRRDAIRRRIKRYLASGPHTRGALDKKFGSRYPWKEIMEVVDLMLRYQEIEEYSAKTPAGQTRTLLRLRPEA